MGEHEKLWKTLGYSALLGALILSVMDILLGYAYDELVKKDIALFGLYGVSMSLPLVTLSEKVKGFFSTGKYGEKTGYMEELSLDFGEMLLVNERPHPLYFIGIALSIPMLIGFFIYNIYFYNHVYDINMLMLSISLAVMFFILSKKIRKNRRMDLIIRSWSLFFALWWTLSVVDILKVQMEQRYPTHFWEKLLGIPGISMILFAGILFIFSSIFWRLDSYLSKKNRGPFSAVSIALMGAGIAIVFPPINFIFSNMAISTIMFVVLLATIAMGTLILSFLVFSGGIRIMLTNRRILISQNFIERKIREHPFDSLISVGIHQGFLGKRFDYGDLILSINTGEEKRTIVLHGIRNPMLIKNTILAMCERTEADDEYMKRPWTSGFPKHMLTHDLRAY